jgi:hypothetical protein
MDREPRVGQSERATGHPDAANAACTLIAASCTTGWFDWIHGELWLCPGGLLRRSVGLWATVRHGDMRGAKRTVDTQNRPTRSFAPDEVRRIVESDRRNRWIKWEDISHATLKGGLVDHSLHLELKDGSRRKFLWLRMDGGSDMLRAALSRALGSLRVTG